MNLLRMWDAPAGTFGLSQTDFLVVAAFSEAEATTDTTEGLAGTILRETGEPMRKATLYGTVKKLERLGLTVQTGSLRIKDGRPQRVFALTDAGRLALQVGEGIGESLIAAGEAEAPGGKP